MARASSSAADERVARVNLWSFELQDAEARETVPTAVLWEISSQLIRGAERILESALGTSTASNMAEAGSCIFEGSWSWIFQGSTCCKSDSGELDVKEPGLE